MGDENSNDDKLKHNRSAKFTDLEVEQLEKIMIAIGPIKYPKLLDGALIKHGKRMGTKLKK